MFACNELNLDEVEVYGFDYDYTLAEYKPSLDALIYDLSLERLINHYKVSGAFQLPWTMDGLHLDCFINFYSHSVSRGDKGDSVQQ